MKIDKYIDDLRSYCFIIEDSDLLNDIIYAASLSDDELDDKFYVCLSDFINCFLFYILNPSVHLSNNDRLIFRKFLVISVFRFKRGLVYLPDTE